MIEYLPILLGAVTFLAGFWVTLRHFRLLRALTYIERFNNPGNVEIRIAVDEWLIDNDESTRVDAMIADPKLHAKIRAFHNLLIELAVAYNYNLVHRKITRENWFVILATYVPQFSSYRDHYRSKEQDASANLIKMCGLLGIPVRIDADADADRKADNNAMHTKPPCESGLSSTITPAAR